MGAWGIYVLPFFFLQIDVEKNLLFSHGKSVKNSVDEGHRDRMKEKGLSTSRSRVTVHKCIIIYQAKHFPLFLRDLYNLCLQCREKNQLKDFYKWENVLIFQFHGPTITVCHMKFLFFLLPKFNDCLFCVSSLMNYHQAKDRLNVIDLH